MSRRHIVLSYDDYVDAYSLACDAICRTCFGEMYEIDPEDPVRHTSDEARRLVNAVFHAVGIEIELPRFGI
jgi:hypothetical protein